MRKVTLTGIRSALYGVPKSIYDAYKKDDKYYVAISHEIHRHWYGMESLRRAYTTTHIGSDCLFREVYEVGGKINE